MVEVLTNTSVTTYKRILIVKNRLINNILLGLYMCPTDLLGNHCSSGTSCTVVASCLCWVSQSLCLSDTFEAYYSYKCYAIAKQDKSFNVKE